MHKCSLGDIEHGLINEPMRKGKLSKSFAQPHMFLKLVKNLKMKMIGVREQPIEPAYNGVQIFGFGEGDPAGVIFTIQQNGC